MKYIEEKGEEILTLSYVVIKMVEHISEQRSEYEAYSLSYMKATLLDHYERKIMISNMNGKQNIVTLINTATVILAEFHKTSKKVNNETEQLRIIEIAEKLIKSYIKKIELLAKTYPS